MTNREVVLCNPVRTVIGTYNGSLKDVPSVLVSGFGADNHYVVFLRFSGKGWLNSQASKTPSNSTDRHSHLAGIAGP